MGLTMLVCRQNRHVDRKKQITKGWFNILALNLYLC